MRTNIVIDDELIKDAMHLSGLATKRETVQRALQLLVKLSQQEQIKKFKGKWQWEGDLDVMRIGDPLHLQEKVRLETGKTEFAQSA